MKLKFKNTIPITEKSNKKKLGLTSFLIHKGCFYKRE